MKNIILFLFTVTFLYSCSPQDTPNPFNPLGTFTDSRDGNVYTTVTIGTQVWMKENLAYLPSVVSMGTVSYTIPYYYVYGFANSTNVAAAKAKANYTIYGVLYNWPAALTACPDGWHLPSDEEWTQLIDYLGGEDIAGGKMKEMGTSHWYYPNNGANNQSGFSGLPGGRREGIGYFGDIGYNGYWWSSTVDSREYAWGLTLYKSVSYVDIFISDKINGFSVRCLRD